MLYNYVKIALRNLMKHRFFSMLNIMGLAIGMSSCLTVILIIRDQLGYDKFHSDPERIFRILCQQEDGSKVATTPYPLGVALTQDFSIAETSVNLVRGIYGHDATTKSNLTLPVDGYYTEPSFFKVFGFSLDVGNATTALSEPNTMVVSKEMAARFFGNNNPVGEVLTLKDRGSYLITGIVATPPGKTHINFDVLISTGSLAALEAAYKPDQLSEKVIGNWENIYTNYVYVKLRPDQKPADLTNALTLVAEARAKAGQFDKGVTYFSQNIDNISPQPDRYANDVGGSAPWFFIWGMAAFVLILTIFPCLNYANMAISQALLRTREMGVRKAIGARNTDVRRMMLTEAVITAFLALGLAYLIHLPLNYFVMDYFPPVANLTDLHASASDWGIFILFGLVVGLLAGWLPAQRLSKLHPSFALRGNNSGESLRVARFGWRKTLLIGQFSLSLIFMIVVATLWSQMRFMTITDYGFQKENLLTIELQGNKAQILGAEFEQDRHVVGVTTTTVQVASNNLQGMPLFKEPGGDDLGIHCAMVDEKYIPVMKLDLLAGENFEQMPENSKEKYLIINEKALDRFQLGSPQEAIGKVLWMSDTMPVTVKGVIRDFHYRTLENGIEPFALRYATGHIMHVRIAPGDPTLAMASLASIWKKVDGDVHPFKATFMEDSMQKAYGHVTFVGGLLSFFSILALSLACLGLLGMVTYSVSTKVKEIGIRKVLGASVAQVTFLLSRHFLILLAIALVIALPLGYLLATQFLQLFVYRIAVNGLILGGSAAALLALGLLTIGLQAGRAALANPAKSLSSE